MVKKNHRAKKGSKENPITSEDGIFDAQGNLLPDQKPQFLIIEAHIKDEQCTYTYKMNVGVPDSHTVDGRGYIKDDMKKAFAKFNVHLAFFDDAFKLNKTEIKDIDKHHTDEITYNYTVTGFKIKGSEEDESIILIGSKHTSLGGRIKMATPKIPLDRSSSYQWYNELKTAADKAREEVKLYKDGKYIWHAEDEDDEDHELDKPQKPKRSRQIKITDKDAVAENPETPAVSTTSTSTITDEQFESGLK